MSTCIVLLIKNKKNRYKDYDRNAAKPVIITCRPSGTRVLFEIYYYNSIKNPLNASPKIKILERTE